MKKINKKKVVSKSSVSKMGPHPINQDALRRLKSIAGQVSGIQRMVEEEKYCIDIFTQVVAAKAALNKVGTQILKRHIKSCVSKAVQVGGKEQEEIIEELIHIISKKQI